MESLSNPQYQEDTGYENRFAPRFRQDLYFDAEPAPETEITQIRPIPFHAVASDFDGVVTLYGKETQEEADRIRELFVQKTLANDVPLAFITGKDEKDVVPQIAEPIRAKLQEMGIELDAGKFMILANNGSVIIDVGLDNHVIEKKSVPL